ncbi:RNA polymerase sigma factor [Duganella sp. sic0402]|uniref:RNA polymerase sigma factor n=1 Tax=Duganella sp. sic0402 TaxID=2854786 RepID=UPI0035A289E6
MPVSGNQQLKQRQLTSDTLTSLYQRWRLPLLRLLQRRTGNRDLAEDATHDVFVRLAASGRALAPAEEAPYLATSARNAATDQWRRSDDADVVSMDAVAQELNGLPDQPQSEPQHIAEQRQRIARLNDAVAELPERQRQAFLLNRIDGLTHDEVAEAMGISARMVSKHLSRAMAYCQLRVNYGSVEQMARLHLNDDATEDAA